MAPEVITSDFVSAVLSKLEELEEKGIDQFELLHAMMFVVSILCNNYGVDEDLATELQHTMFTKVNVALGDAVVMRSGETPEA